ncbi:hypothetical protein [Sporanaerobacter acetigenes]
MDKEILMKKIEEIIEKYENIENITVEIGFRNKEKDYYYEVEKFEIES